MIIEPSEAPYIEEVNREEYGVTAPRQPEAPRDLPTPPAQDRERGRCDEKPCGCASCRAREDGLLSELGAREQQLQQQLQRLENVARMLQAESTPQYETRIAPNPSQDVGQALQKAEARINELEGQLQGLLAAVEVDGRLTSGNPAPWKNTQMRRLPESVQYERSAIHPTTYMADQRNRPAVAPQWQYPLQQQTDRPYYPSVAPIANTPSIIAAQPTHQPYANSQLGGGAIIDVRPVVRANIR